MKHYIIKREEIGDWDWVEGNVPSLVIMLALMAPSSLLTVSKL